MSGKNAQTHRELELLDALRRSGGFARNSQLAVLLDVSEETVRRTIKALSKAGTIARVHGGAYLVGTQSDPSFFRRIAQRSDEKRLIAQEVARKISDGMSLFLDVGSTTAFVAEELRVRHNLTIATNSVGVAQALVGHNSNRIFLLGGEMHSDELGAFGFVAERQARRISYDYAILSADAINDKLGFLYLNPAEADLAAAVMENAEMTLIGMDQHKFGTTAPHRGFHPDQVDLMVSDTAPRKGLSEKLNDWGITVNIAKGKERNAAAE